MAGTIAKYLATSFAIENVVIEPRVIRSCLPIAMTSSSLVGSESRSTMLAASLAADVPLFIASPTSDWASAGASFVPSPVIATRWPSACSLRMNAILCLGRRLGDEVVDAGLAGDRRRGARVVAGDHDRPDAHLAELGEALDEALLDGVLELDGARGRDRPPRSPAAWRPGRRCASVAARISGGRLPSSAGGDRVHGALEDVTPVDGPDAAGAGLGPERDVLDDASRRARAKPASSSVPAGLRRARPVASGRARRRIGPRASRRGSRRRGPP